MVEYNVTKIVYMSAFGVDDSYQGLNWLMKFAASHTKLAREFADHKDAEHVLRESSEGIRWVITRPVMLRNGDAAMVKSLGEHGEDRKRFMDGVTRASVAKFMVKAAENDQWDLKTPVIYNP
jgi:hypothetical protein